jgi:DNA-binding MarR family transcriptional regulator
MNYVPGDRADEIATAWAALLDVDASSVGVVDRTLWLGARLMREADALARTHGLSSWGEFEVLGALRRTDAPTSPGALRSLSGASGAAVSKHIRALEARALLVRSPDPADGRGALLTLTPKGARIAEAVMRANLERGRALVAGIDVDAAARALRQLEQALDG